MHYNNVKILKPEGHSLERIPPPKLQNPKFKNLTLKKTEITESWPRWIWVSVENSEHVTFCGGLSSVRWYSQSLYEIQSA